MKMTKRAILFAVLIGLLVIPTVAVAAGGGTNSAGQPGFGFMRTAQDASAVTVTGVLTRDENAQPQFSLKTDEGVVSLAGPGLRDLVSSVGQSVTLTGVRVQGPVGEALFLQGSSPMGQRQGQGPRGPMTGQRGSCPVTAAR